MSPAEPEDFTVDGLGGWLVEGRGAGLRQVLLLHGGPAMSHAYLRRLADSLTGWDCASFQQRGRAPSTQEGPFDVPTFVDDVRRVLDHLATRGWERPLVAGHSWGGHLAWHVAVTLGDLVGGVLAIDPLGATGDLGAAELGATVMARLPPPARARYDELDAKAESGGLTEAEELEQLALIVPAYLADPARAADLPPSETGTPVASEFDLLMASAAASRPALESALPTVRVPLGAVHGALSPLPVWTSLEATDLVPGAWTEVVPDCGHFVWLEAPDAVPAALERLLAEQGRVSPG